MENTYYSAKEAASILNLSRVTLYKLARTKKLPTIKVGGSLLFEKNAVETYSTISSAKIRTSLTAKSSSKEIDYWMIPRSKRKLVSLQEMIKNDFVNGIIGSQWKGTRSNHRQRDKNLQIAKIRGGSYENFVDQNPGGARTDVALLAALGFYAFDEAGCIHLTFQGRQMLDSKEPAKIITQQLLQVRYPSPYSTSINMNPSFKIFPYRFLLHLLTSDKLLDDGVIYANDGKIRLTQKEIAKFVITEAYKDSDLDRIIENVTISRLNNAEINVEDKYIDIANTFINNLEITGWIERGHKSSMWIKDECIHDVLEALAQKPRSFSYTMGKEFEFQDRLGMDPTKSKYTKSITANRTSGEIAVKILLLDFLKNHPINFESINNDLIRMFAKNAGTSVAIATEVFNEVLRNDPTDYFSVNYLKLATSGRTHAREFELATAEVFFEIAKNAKWVGKEGKSPDIIFNLTQPNNLHQTKCIVDCKAESNFSISNDHFNRMTVEENGYIQSYDADIFIYVASNFSRSFEKNLKRIEDKCKIPGSGITAKDLLYLLQKNRISPASVNRIVELFSIGRIITVGDINSIF